MAIYRSVQMAFWTDAKIVDNFTPEDRYFYLYLFTNPHTNLCGCYEISIRQISNEIGYSKNAVENLIDRFIHVHHVLDYSSDTHEILLVNWHKYNWIRSDKFRKALMKEIQGIKHQSFRGFLESVLARNDTVSIPYEYRMDIPDSDSVTVTGTDSVTDSGTGTSQKYPYMEIIGYLNEKAGTAYRHTSRDTRGLIKTRIDQGFGEQDFYTVIDKKVAEWKGTEMEKYLRPMTLFGTKFESYLNQQMTHRNNDRYSVVDDWVRSRTNDGAGV